MHVPPSSHQPPHIPPAPPLPKKEPKQPKGETGNPLDQKEGADLQGRLSEVSESEITGVSAAIVGILDRISNLFQYAWGCLKNPLDPPWRNQKYTLVLDEIGKHFRSYHQFSDEAIEKFVQDTPESSECKKYLETAVELLHKPATEQMSSRERYKAFMEAFTKALETPYYKEKVNEGNGGLSGAELRKIEEENPEIAALHVLARAQFMGVHVTSFINDVSNKIAEVGGLPPIEIDRKEYAAIKGMDRKKGFLIEALETRINSLEKNGEAVAKADPEHKTYFWTSWFSSLKGTVTWLDFDPLNTGGNPANVHHTRTYPEGECMIIRTPSPTIGKNIHPAFKALLRSMKAREEHYTYFNFQNREGPTSEDSFWKKTQEFFGFQAEHHRVQSLEALNTDEEFKDVIQVASLDKQSPFYWQTGEVKAAKNLLTQLVQEGALSKEQAAQVKAQLDKDPRDVAQIEIIVSAYKAAKGGALPPQICMGKDEFIETFMRELFGQKGFHLPPRYHQEDHKQFIEDLLKKIGETYFEGIDALTPLERQDFIEIAYDLLEDYMMNTSTHATLVCKDNIDRGGAENGKKHAKDLLVDIIEMDKNTRQEGLVKQVETWHEMLEGLPLWARKRGLLHERRQRLSTATKRMIAFAQKDPKTFLELQKWTRIPMPILKEPYLFSNTERPSVEEAVKKYSTALKEITDKFDLATLERTLHELPNFPKHNLEKGDEELIICARQCEIHHKMIKRYLKALNEYCKGDNDWDDWKDNPNRTFKSESSLNKEYRFIRDALAPHRQKQALIKQIVRRTRQNPAILQNLSTSHIEFNDKQEAQGITKRRITRLNTQPSPLSTTQAKVKDIKGKGKEKEEREKRT